MTTEEINLLVEKYFNAEGYKFPTHFEHRYDPDSSAITYSLIRHFKPQTILHIGTWEGGSTCLIMAALLKNNKIFQYIAAELLSDKREKTAQHCLEKNNLSPMIIGNITNNLLMIPDEIDFLFHDTDHDLETTKWIFENIVPKLKNGALINFHDWAVTDNHGIWSGKIENGMGGWPETEYMLGLHREGKLPFKKLYFNYGIGKPSNREAGFFIYKKPK